jgi:hypothetical protein
MSNAVSAYGTLLKIGDGGGTEVFTTLAEVKSIEGPTMETDIVDVTTHSSAASGAFREKLATLIDAGEVTFDLNFVPGDRQHTQLRTDQLARTKRNFEIWYPGSVSADIEFQAVVTNFPLSFPVDGPMESSVTLTITQAPTFN